MRPFPNNLLSFFTLTLAWAIAVWVMPCSGIAEAGKKAKSAYMTADACHQDLKKSPARQQKVSAWLNCIKRYKAVYRFYPDDAWAPAGMFKAAELYFQLFKKSTQPTYRDQAMDLTARLQKKYPKSAYSGRAKILAAAIKKTAAKNQQPVKLLKSKKAETRDDAAIARYKLKKLRKKSRLIQLAAASEIEKIPLAPVPLKTEKKSSAQPTMTGRDIRVTDLRFWSNPEYSRIVINAEGERPYSHRLLKKDPKLNVQLQRLYIDIEKARLGKGIAVHTPINDDLLKQARAGQFTPHTVRVVVDIKAFENYKVFSLKDPFRIVIDVWGKNGRAVPTDEMQSALASGQDQAPLHPKTTPTEKTDPVTTDNLKSSDITRQLALGVRKIVIDPGHGGKDPGAPGYIKGVWEKDIVLELSKRLATKLRTRLNCEVLLTRKTDTKLTLEERTAIANTKRADLFISMHCNAAQNKQLAGIETYILNLATDDQAISVAARENATSKKNISDLEYILSDLMKHAKIEESTRLANDVHKAMVKGMKEKYPKIHDLGVKQAPFYVLLGARMPSILIESSFISNKVECNRLMTQSYRDAISSAIADGVEKYINATNPKHL